MKSSDVVNILELINLAAKYGTPLILEIVSQWKDNEEVTPTMIAKLRADIKPAADLFPELDE